MNGAMKKYAALAGLLTVAACGGSAPGTALPQTTPTAGGTPRQGPPGVSGLLAALSGNTLQVQSTSAQTAVTYSAATAFTDTVKASAAEVTVGSCVMVRSSNPSTSSTPPTSVTATSVSVSAPVNGSCAAGAGGPRGFGGPGGPPPGGGGTPPSGAPGRGRFGGGEFGKVVSTSATGFVISSTRTAGATASPTSSTVTVTANAATTYTAAKKATAAALKVGQCVTARGAADSVGTVAATSISIRPATNGSCTTFGGPGA